MNLSKCRFAGVHAGVTWKALRRQNLPSIRDPELIRPEIESRYFAIGLRIEVD